MKHGDDCVMDLSKLSLFFKLRFGVCVSVAHHSLMIQTGLSFDCIISFL